MTDSTPRPGLFDRPESPLELRFKVSACERDAVKAEAKRRRCRLQDVMLEALALEHSAVDEGDAPIPRQSALFSRSTKATASLSVYLSGEELAWIDEQAKARSSSRSEVVVDALRRYFASRR